MDRFIEMLSHDFRLPFENPVLVFSLILFIILLSPILLRKLRIPGIIGLIISGVVVGPHGFNLLEKNSAVELFSTIGLLYIMFIAGLELDLGEFKKNKNKSLLFGFFTFILPLSIGFPLCHYVLGYGYNASFLTASMFATHTLVAYPIVSKMGMAKNQAVAVTVGGTILTDTAVLLILAIIMSNSEGTLNQEFWLRLGISVTIFLGIMFFLIPKITKWFFKRLENEKHAHYIFVLSVVFFSAFLAEVSGLEPIIGAFVAGLALNSLIPHSSALMNRIEFIGNSLFIPFFLVSVGMLVNLQVILSGSMAIFVAVVLTLGAIFGKWLAAYFTQLSFKYSNAQRQLIFGLSSSHAAATLAVILVGYNAGILDENILNGTIILILVTCLVASFATERAAKKLLVLERDSAKKNVMTTPANSDHLLLPVANTLNIEKLLQFTMLIKDKSSTNPVSILSIVPNNREAEHNIIATKKRLEAFKNIGAASEIKINTLATIDHNIANGIARISKEILADNIIVGWPSRVGIIDKFIGERIYTIIESVNKNLFVCHIEQHLINHKRMILITPPLAEKEAGFDNWLQKISKLSQELTIPVQLYGTNETWLEIKTKINENLINLNVEFTEFTDWARFKGYFDHVASTDLIIVVSAKRNSPSYSFFLDSIASKIERKFALNNKILIYPQ